MLQCESLRLWTPEEIEQGQTADVSASDARTLQEIITWSREYLMKGSPDLGRDGPVCPFTKPSVAKHLYYVATPHAGNDLREIRDVVLRYRKLYDERAKTLEGNEKNLLTFLIPLPDLDRTVAEPLDRLQERLKNDFVKDGLMIGQFHPKCSQGGLWNSDFRPLRCPVPMLVIRVMVLYDLPFLMDQESHVDAYLAQFAKEIPPRVRAQLLGKLFAGSNKEDAADAVLRKL